MFNKTTRLGLSLFAILAGGPVSTGQVQIRPRTAVDYQPVNEISIGGDAEPGFMAVDAAARRLYLCHQTEVVVIDLDKDAVAGRIGGLAGVRGFALAPELGLGFSANSLDGKAAIIDLKTQSIVSKVEAGREPSVIAFDSDQQEVYVFSRRSQSATVFEAKTGKPVGVVPLPGQPAAAAVDPDAARVFCTSLTPGSDEHEVASIDHIKFHTIADDWRISPGLEPGGMAIDAERHRLFVACNLSPKRALDGINLPGTGLVKANGLILMMSAINGTVITRLRTGLGVEGIAFDPGTRLLFCLAAQQGSISISHEDSPQRLSLAQVMEAPKGIRFVAVDPKTHKLYVSAAEFETRLPVAAGIAAPRPRALQDTLRVLVFAPGK
jgi:DNA-binding beta-propeller fold protein YncE